MSSAEVLNPGGVMPSLGELEAEITSSYNRLVTSLFDIFERDLWREDEHYLSFEDYCERRWGYKKAQAYRLVSAGKLQIDLLAADKVQWLPESERQARELLKVPEPQREEAARKVADRFGPRPTSGEIRAVVENEYVRPPKQKHDDLTPMQRKNRADIRAGIRQASIAIAGWPADTFANTQGLPEGAMALRDWLNEAIEAAAS